MKYEIYFRTTSETVSEADTFQGAMEMVHAFPFSNPQEYEIFVNENGKVITVMRGWEILDWVSRHYPEDFA